MSIYRRGKIWWVRFQAQGVEIRQSARTTSQSTALKYERELREQYATIARGGQPRRSYREAMERFILEHLPTLKPETQRRYRSSAKALHPHLEGLWLDQINRGILSDMLAYWQREAKARDTKRNNLACLSSMFSMCIDWDWCDSNPVQSLRKRALGAPVARTRYLRHEEEAALLAHARGYMHPMIAFAIDSGLRLEEQLSMTWDQVDLKRLEIVVPITKTSTPRVIPLLERSAQILAHHPRHISSNWVWCKSDGSRYGKLTRGLAGAAKRADVTDLKWHDLRRTCGTRRLKSGMPLEKVSKWLGHKTIAVTQRSYAFLDVSDLHAEVGTKTGTEHGD